MPATDEYRLGNSIGVPLPQWVIKQLEHRSKKLSQSKNTNEELLFKANRSAWVRMVSSIDVISPPSLSEFDAKGNQISVSPDRQKIFDNLQKTTSNSLISYFFNNYGISIKEPSDLAKKFVLQGGISKYENDGSQFSYNLAANLNDTYNVAGPEEVTNYGYRPMPGITSVRIQTQGKLGSVRSAEIQLKVWDKAQLDIIDTLYFKLGYSMLLEWGNTCYYKSDKDTFKWSEDLTIDPFKISWTKENILNQISKNVYESEGNYDAMLGIVTNFNFTYNQEGGYDCTVKLLSLGVLISEMKMNNPRVLPDIREEVVKKLVDTIIALQERELAKNATKPETKEKSPSDIQEYPACLRNRPNATLKSLGFEGAKYKYAIEYSINGVLRYFYIDGTFQSEGLKEAGSYSCDQNGNLIVGGVNQDTTAKTEYTEVAIKENIKRSEDNNIPYYLYFASDKPVTDAPDYQGADLFSEFLLEARNPSYKRGYFINRLSAIIPDESNSDLASQVKVKLDYAKFLEKYNKDSGNAFINPKSWRGATLGFYVYSDTEYLSKLGGQDLTYNIETRFDWEAKPVKSSVESSKSGDYVKKVMATVPTIDIAESIDLAAIAQNKQKVITAITQALANPNFLLSVESTELSSIRIGKIQPVNITLTGTVIVKFPVKVKLENYTLADKLVEGDTEIKEVDYKFPFSISFNDTYLIQGIQSTNKIAQPKNFVNYKTSAEAATAKSPVQEQAQPEETPPPGPTLNVSDIQKSESLKYKSAFEVMIRTIQLYSLDKALESSIESDLKVKELNLIDSTNYSYFTKKLFSTGLFSSMLDDLIRVHDKEDPYWKTKCENYDTQISSTGVCTDMNLMMLVRAYFGFHAGLSGNVTTASELFKNGLNVDYNYLFKTYTVPYDMSAGVLEGTQINHPVYISLGLVVMILNHICLMYDSDNATHSNRPMVYIDFNNKTNLCLSNAKQLSTNPYDILIGFYGNNKDFESILEPTVIGYKDGKAYIGKEGFSEPAEVFTPRPIEGVAQSNQVCDRLSGALPPYKIVETKYEAYRGRTMNILINTDYLLRQVSSYAKRNGSGDVYVKEFLEQILFDVNKYIGDINTFRLAYDDNSNTIHVIDDQYTPNLENKYIPESNKSILPVFGVGSIARNLEIRTEITSRVSNLLAISANANTNNLANLSKSSDSYGIYNIPYKDRYIPNRTEYATVENIPTDAMVNSTIQFNESIKTFYSSCTPAENSVAHATNYYIQRMSKIKTAELGTRAAAMIPVSLNFGTDGISGLGMGYTFAIPEQFLPYTYNQIFDEYGTVDRLHKVGFVMVGLDQTIENNIWTSNIRANMIYLKKAEDFKYDIDKPNGPLGFTPSEFGTAGELGGSGGSNKCGSCESRKIAYKEDPSCSRRQSGKTVDSFSFSSMATSTYKQDNSISSPNKNVGGMKKIVGVIIHHSAGSMEADKTIMQTAGGPNPVSYHTIIGRDGTQHNFVGESDRAWHAGCSYFEHPNIPGGSTCDDVNSYFLGLSFEGAPNFVGKGGTQNITEVEIDSAAKWIVDKIKRHSMPTDLSTITTHGVVSCGRKDDVVRSVELAIKNRIKQLI